MNLLSINRVGRFAAAAIFAASGLLFCHRAAAQGRHNAGDTGDE
jgi:hypothetical protein